MTIGQWGANYEWFEPSSNCIILQSIHLNQATMHHRTAILEFTEVLAQSLYMGSLMQNNSILMQKLI